MPRPRKAPQIVQRGDSSIIVTARAKALEADILMLHYTGSTQIQIAKRFGIEPMEVSDCMRTASDDAHKKAWDKAAQYPDMARQTLKGFAPRAAEIVKEIAEDEGAKPGTRLNAALTALEASGTTAKAPTNVNIFPVLSKEELKELVGAAVASGVTVTPAEEAKIVEAAALEEPIHDDAA